MNENLARNLDFNYCFNPENTSEAAQCIEAHGFVVLQHAVPTEPLAKLRERMDSDTEELLRYCDSIGGNPRQFGHLQQGPPPTKEFVFKEVVMNPYMVEVCTSLLGPTPTLTFYNGNTNCPGSVEQHLHMDGAHRSKSPDPVDAPFSVVVNVPLGPMNKQNGAIQLWPGSHMVRNDKDDRAINPDQMRQRAVIAPPIQPITEPGDVLIRDIRLWHRGVPNPSDRPRHMIALIVTDGLDKPRHKLRFETGCETELEGFAIDSNASYQSEPTDYLIGPTRRIYEHAQRARQAQSQDK